MVATKLLTATEVRNELSLDSDSMDDEQAEALAQYASDRIYEATKHDWGADDAIDSIAKQCAREIIYQSHNRLTDRLGVVNDLLGVLQDRAKEALENGSEA